MNEILSAIPFSLLLAVAAGPIFFIVIETSISKGVRAAFTVDLGAVLADLVFIGIVFLGTKPLLNSIQDNPRWFVLGGILLTFFGLISFFKNHKEKSSTSNNEHPQPAATHLLSYLAKGFFINLINTGALLFWLGMFFYFGPKFDMDTQRIVLFFSTVLAGYLIIGLIKIILAKQLKNRLTPQRIYTLKQAVNILLIGFGLFFIFQGLFPKQKEQLLNNLNDIQVGKVEAPSGFEPLYKLLQSSA